MGAAGKKYLRIAHSKSNSPPSQAKDGGYGTPPHPLRVVGGQRYWPRYGDQRRTFQAGRVQAADRLVWGRFLDMEEGKARVSEARLLARREDGHGRFFAFGGFAPRRYSTWATLVAFDEDTAVLVLPEWHPARPLRLPRRLVAADDLGAWMSCRADLAVGRSAQLNVSDLKVCRDPGADRCHRPAYSPPEATEVLLTPELGRFCGDIVLESPEDPRRVYQHVGGLLDIHVPDRPARVAAGGRVYVATPDAAVTQYFAIRAVRQSPNGLFLACDPQPHPTGSPVPLPDGQRVRHRWRWRWWPRSLDDARDTPADAFSTYPYDRIEHMGEHVLKSRPLPVG